MKLQLIEFTQDTVNEAGEVKRRAGDRVRVDLGSAVSLVDKKKVAKRVEADTVEDGDRSEVAVKELPVQNADGTIVSGDVDTPASETALTGEGEPETPATGRKRGAAAGS